jgi:hypothetical protein
MATNGPIADRQVSASDIRKADLRSANGPRRADPQSAVHRPSQSPQIPPFIYVALTAIFDHSDRRPVWLKLVGSLCYRSGVSGTYGRSVQLNWADRRAEPLVRSYNLTLERYG